MDIGQTPHAGRGAPSPTLRIAVLLGAVLLVGALVVFVSTRGGGSNGSITGTETNATTQTNEGGNVIVSVTWSGAAAGPRFDVKLDTHVVDLDSVDLRTLAVLRVDGRDVQPLSWDAPKGGHHREGALVFPATAADGSPVIGPSAKTIELVIRNVAGVPERVFTWTL